MQLCPEIQADEIQSSLWISITKSFSNYFIFDRIVCFGDFFLERGHFVMLHIKSMHLINLILIGRSDVEARKLWDITRSVFKLGMEGGGYGDSWLAKYRFHCTDFLSLTYHLKKKISEGKFVQSDCFITKIKCKIKNENRSYAVANSFVVQSFNFTNFTKHSLGYADNCKKGMFYFLQKLCSLINSFVLNNRPPH